MGYPSLELTAMMSIHRFLPALALVSILSACGGEVVASSTDGVGRVLRLAPVPATPYPAADITVAAEFSVEGAEFPPGWSVTTGAEHAEVRHEVGRRFGGPWFGVTAPEANAFTLRIQGPHDPEKFNRVALTLAARDKVDISLAFHRAKQAPLRTPLVRYDGDGRPTTVMIDVLETTLYEKPFDFLSIQVRRINHMPAILGVDLLYTSLAPLAPGGAQAGAPVTLRGESRTGWGLPLGLPLDARVQVPAGTLRFGYARPAGLSDPRQKLSIRASFRDGDEEVAVKKIDLPRGGSKVDWHEAAVPVPADAVGRDLTIRFELISNSEREAVAVLASPRIEARGLDAPTVVLITSDTHRADHLGLASERGVGVATPFLDSLAAEGVYFADCYSATNITNPSHGSLLTALPVRDTGISDNITLLSPEASTLPELFHASGWRTLASVSAKHLKDGQSGLGQGFDRMDFPVAGDRDSKETVARLAEMMADAEGLPLFAWLHVFDAHGPYLVPDDHRWLYYDEQRDPYAEDLPPLPAAAQPAWDKEVRDIGYVLSQYKSEVTYLDGVLATFFENPRLARAIVAVTSDHGECLGEQGQYYTHSPLAPATLDVPLILRWPGAPAGTRVETPVANTDLGRTLLDLANLGHLDFPGRNLLNTLDAPGAAPQPRFAISSHATSAAIEEGGWYLVLRLSTTAQGRRHEVELYHVAQDPECRENLVETQFDRARELRAKLVAWLDAAPTKRLSHAKGAPDAATLSELAALGYADDGGGGGDGPWYEPDPDDPWCQRFAN